MIGLPYATPGKQHIKKTHKKRTRRSFQFCPTPSRKIQMNEAMQMKVKEEEQKKKW